MSTTLDAATIRRLADMHAVYRLFDEAGCLLYVGMSGRTGGRFDDHAIKNWWPLVRTITLEWHDTKAQAALAERRAISAEHPRYNKAGLKPSQQQTREMKLQAAKEEQRIVEETAQVMRELLSRDLLADLDTLLSDRRVKLRDLAGQLRALAPGWAPYQKMNGARLREELKRKGVRTINTSGVHYLDPAYLRQARRKVA